MADEPTPEQLEQMQAVSAAGAKAAAGGADPAAAMKSERDRVELKLSDEDIDQIAAKFNELNIESFRKAGAFDPPPEPVHPPEQPTAPPGPGEPPTPETHQPHEKRTFAHRFMGY